MSCCASVFFFKQKTAYEMRISDWSSDVCSSDLQQQKDDRRHRGLRPYRGRTPPHTEAIGSVMATRAPHVMIIEAPFYEDLADELISGARSEGRRVGKECVTPCGSRWWQYLKKKKKQTIHTSRSIIKNQGH